MDHCKQTTDAAWYQKTSEALALIRQYAIFLSIFDINKPAPLFATGTCLLTSQGPALVTAGHVIEKFARFGAQGRLQVGMHRKTLRYRPDIMRIYVGQRADLGTILLPHEVWHTLGVPMLKWAIVATTSVREGELIAGVGYPGCLKRQTADNAYGIGTYEFIVTVRVETPEQFTVLIDVNANYERELDSQREGFSPDELTELGGLSGAPVFSLERWQIVGWLYEAHSWQPAPEPEAHSLCAVPTSFLHEDGTISG